MDGEGWRYAMGIVLLVLLYLVARPHIGDEYRVAIIAVPIPLPTAVPVPVGTSVPLDLLAPRDPYSARQQGSVPTAPTAPFPAQTPPTTLPGAFPSLLECRQAVATHPEIVAEEGMPFIPAPGGKMYAMRCERHYALLWGWDR